MHCFIQVYEPVSYRTSEAFVMYAYNWDAILFPWQPYIWTYYRAFIIVMCVSPLTVLMMEQTHKYAGRSPKNTWICSELPWKLLPVRSNNTTECAIAAILIVRLFLGFGISSYKPYTSLPCCHTYALINHRTFQQPVVNAWNWVPRPPPPPFA